MVIKDIICIMVVDIFTVACWLHVESNYCHLVYLRRRLLLLVSSRWNMFHVEPYCFMPRNNLAKTSHTSVDLLIGRGGVSPTALLLPRPYQRYAVFSIGPPATPPDPHQSQGTEPLASTGPSRPVHPLSFIACKILSTGPPTHGRGRRASRPSSWSFSRAPPCQTPLRVSNNTCNQTSYIDAIRPSSA